MTSAPAISQSTRNLQPWEAHPYKLLSWWDMEKFSAAAFQQIVMGLALFTGQIEKMPPETHAGDLAVTYLPLVKSIRTECEKIGLRTSMVCADEFTALAEGMTVKALTSALREFENTIRREMASCFFFHMPSKQAEYYQKNMLFGARVDVRIPATQFDITEAGNCYAMGRGTACVFHLMRVMEIGVQKLGELLGVPLAEEKNWQVILDLVNKAVKSLPPNAPRTVALGQVAAHLFNVKIGWRNPVMHPRETYTLEEAGNLIGNVKAFMVTLSTLLPVPKSGPTLVV
jgi:hypothetical protein